MTWLAILGAVAIVGLGLWWWGKMPRAALELAGAALLLGVAGYAWQGSPMQPGSPVAAADAARPPEPASAAIRKARSGQFSSEGEILSYADAFINSGHSQTAASIINAALLKSPNNPDLWVGLGNALVVHGNGQMSPAAQFAFEKAASLSPDHPGPPFFLGLGLVQAGKLDEAGEVWRGLLARAPDGATWKADLIARLTQIDQMPIPKGSAVAPK